MPLGRDGRVGPKINGTVKTESATKREIKKIGCANHCLVIIYDQIQIDRDYHQLSVIDRWLIVYCVVCP